MILMSLQVLGIHLESHVYKHLLEGSPVVWFKGVLGHRDLAAVASTSVKHWDTGIQTKDAMSTSLHLEDSAEGTWVFCTREGSQWF